MKRIIFVLVMTMMMAFAGVCSAYDGGDLNKEQKVAETFISSFQGKEAPEFKVVTKDFAQSLQNNFDEKKYSALKRDVKVNYGNLLEIKFYTFQRFDQGDRVTYLAGFDKEQAVAIVLSFDKNNKLTDYTLAPINTGK